VFQVLEIFDMRTTLKENPWKYMRSTLSTIFKMVDKSLPESLDETHRVGNPASEASKCLEKAFKREGKVKLKNLVVDCEYVRQGEVL